MIRCWFLVLIVVEVVEDWCVVFVVVDLVLVVFGMVSLDLVVNDVFMVIGYDVVLFSWMIIGMLLKIDIVMLVNLVSEMCSVFEFIGCKC